MTRINWDDKRYESGISNGVLYVDDSPGVPWNGLTSVTQELLDATVTPLYFDGTKYLDYREYSEFQATIEAYSAPVEFSKCLGELSVFPGFILTKQFKSRFGLTYKTKINETDYKIHLLYNASATSGSKNYRTISDRSEPTVRNWVVNAVPIQSNTYKSAAHYIVDSRKVSPSGLIALEGHLYGTDTTEPTLVTPDYAITILTGDIILEPIDILL